MYKPPIKKKDVKYIPINEMENITQRILYDAYGKEYIKKKVDIDEIAEFILGFDIDNVYLSHNHCYLGMMIFNDDTVVRILDCDNLNNLNKLRKDNIKYISSNSGTILLDKSLSDEGNEMLRRFTLAHECGHGVLHKKYFTQDKNQLALLDQTPRPIACRYNSINFNISTGNSKKKLLITAEDVFEWQANTFASCVLMNREALTFYLAEAGLVHANINDIIYGISDHFGVSKAAAEVRLKVLGYFKDKFTNASNGLAKQIVF